MAPWLEPNDILGSAVRYVASLSKDFNWVGIYLLKGAFLELGPFVGAATDHVRIPVGRGICGRAVLENQDLNIPNVHEEENYLACSIQTQSELVVLIRNRTGEVVGQIDIDSHKRNAFGADEERQVKDVAEVLAGFL